MIGKAKCSDHRLVRARIALNLKRTRTILTTKRQANTEVVKIKTTEFRIAIENKYDALQQEEMMT